MADQATTYDLVLLLSIDAPEEQRTRVLSAVESAITGAGGAVERNDDWGRRPMAYEIRHRPEAEYHLLQFQAPPTVIEDLSHTLRITDGVMRFRIIKVRRGTPPVKAGPPPVVSAVAGSGSGPSSGSDSGRSGSTPEPAQPSSEQPPAEESPSTEESPSPAAESAEEVPVPTGAGADTDDETPSAE
jgi:small subunit ribosomal protein S6